MAPKTDEIFPLVKRFVAKPEGDLAVAPFLNLGLGAPPSMAHGETTQ